LPAVTGVYYTIKWYSYLYWEKYKHQKRVNQHFTVLLIVLKKFKLKYLPYLTKKQEVNGCSFLRVKKSRKTNLNTIEHSEKYFQWALYPEMDEKVT
jgi:hypothetical protein